MSTKLEILCRNLAELEKRAAMRGPSQADLFTLNQIEELRAQIRRETGKEPEAVCRQPATPPDPTPSPISEATPPFILQLLGSADEHAQVQVRQSPVGGESPPCPLRLPYPSAALPLLMNALAQPFGRLTPNVFTATEVEQLTQWGLIQGDYLLQTALITVGQALYQALFPPPISELFFAALTQAKTKRQALPVRLLFDANSAVLAAYPWELLADPERRPLVADGVIALTRYIAHPAPVQPLTVQPPLRVLLVSPRPRDLPTLPAQAEPDAIRAALAPLASQGLLVLEQLATPTRASLLAYLSKPANRAIHLIHFDGHGVYAKLCPTCQTPYTVTSQQCKQCGYPLTDVAPQGYLAFENADHQTAFISARTFANTLAQNQVQVLVLSACRSGQVGSEHLFSGVGPALIQVGIPSVVALQLPIPDRAATTFFQTVYGQLAAFQPLVAAISRGRQALYDDHTNPPPWFIPVLYLRSQDAQGHLLQAPPITTY